MEQNSQELAAKLDKDLKTAYEHLDQALTLQGQRIEPRVCMMLCDIRKEFNQAGQLASVLSESLGNTE